MRYRLGPSELPDAPEVPEEQRRKGSYPLRYEDVDREGHVSLPSMTHGLGATAWRALHRHPLGRALRERQILPVLGRLRVEGGGGPVSVFPDLEVEGSFEVVEVTGAGEPRFRLDMWADVWGVAGRLNMPPPKNAGERVWVGRLLGEHVLTRPFAPREERAVRALPEGIEVAYVSRPFAPPESVLALPEGAEALDPSPALDPAPLAFGLAHSDSNQHVNSLVYPRLFIEAALRRFHALDLPTRGVVRAMDVAFRKPAFDGEVLFLRLQAYRGARGGLGAAGAFVASQGAPIDARAHCFVRVDFLD